MPVVSDPICEIEGVTLVVVGNFNPAIFQPQWFARHELVRPSEVDEENLKIEIIRPEIAAFTMGPFRCDIDLERFVVSTATLDATNAVKDLVLGTFRILEHSPATQLGINRDMHFKMASKDEWHAVGDALAPKGIWDGLMQSPGMHTIQMMGKREGSPASHFLVTVQPSTRVEPGVYIGTNEHFAAAQEQPVSQLMALLEEHWQEAQRHARQTATELLRRGIRGPR